MSVNSFLNLTEASSLPSLQLCQIPGCCNVPNRYRDTDTNIWQEKTGNGQSLTSACGSCSVTLLCRQPDHSPWCETAAAVSPAQPLRFLPSLRRSHRSELSEGAASWDMCWGCDTNRMIYKQKYYILNTGRLPSRKGRLNMRKDTKMPSWLGIVCHKECHLVQYTYICYFFFGFVTYIKEKRWMYSVMWMLFVWSVNKHYVKMSSVPIKSDCFQLKESCPKVA